MHTVFSNYNYLEKKNSLIKKNLRFHALEGQFGERKRGPQYLQVGGSVQSSVSLWQSLSSLFFTVM